jgi:hypothetical protein
VSKPAATPLRADLPLPGDGRHRPRKGSASNLVCMSTPKTVGSRRRSLYGLLAGGLMTATAATVIALPLAGTASADPPCNQTVGDSINSYLLQHPDLHQQLQARAQAEGDNGNVMDYLNRHPDVRQHLIDLSQQCAP